MPDAPVKVKSGGYDLLYSTVVTSNGNSPVDVILGENETVTLRLVTVLENDGKPRWTSTAAGSVLTVQLINPPFLSGVTAPIKVGVWQIGPDQPRRGLYLSATAATYGNPLVSITYFITLYLGETVS